MMRTFLSRIDRSVALGVGVLVASLALLAVAFVSIFAALNNDGANLPEEGTLQEILGENLSEADQSATTNLDLGPLPAPPTRLAVPRLYIDAPVITMGLDGEGNPQVPDRPDQVAWYNFAASPGQRSNAVLSGHVDWQTQSRQPIPGVFYRLRELELGDKMTIALEDGTKLEYRVTGNVAEHQQGDEPYLERGDHADYVWWDVGQKRTGALRRELQPPGGGTRGEAVSGSGRAPSGPVGARQRSAPRRL